jgi:hypothetical protein
VQVTVPSVHVHPVPLIAVAERPTGNVSTTVTVPTVPSDPILFTVSEYTAPISPSRKLPVCDLVIVKSGAITLMEAEAVFPAPPFVELTAPVVLLNVPCVALVTLTLIVHEEFAATVPPVRLAAPEPAVAVTAPPQVLLSAFGVETISPAGNVSVKATPVSATEFAAGFVIVRVNTEFVFAEIDAGANAFAITGGATAPRLAEAVPPVPPSTEVTFPVVLFLVPAVVLVVFTAKVHAADGASVAPVRLTVPVACTAIIVPPPHEPVRPLGVETTSPAGNASVNAMPESADVALLF